MKTKTVSKNIDDKVNDWLSTLPDDIRKYVGNKTVVTGGCIASMLLQEPVNDYDIYFKDVKAVLLVAKHYCDLWTDEYKEGNKSESVSGKLVPRIKISFRQSKPVVYDPKDVGNIIDDKETMSDVIRVELFIKSAGVLGDNPDSEYKYFESRPQDEAAEYLDNTLCNGDELNSQDKGKYRITFMSSNAITLSDKVQLVLRFYGEPNEIHDTYDFIHATNYWTKKDGLVTNTRALEALLARELVYSGSKYPLASIFRTRKFIQRGWSCHIGNYVKMAMQLNDLDLTEPETLEDQLTGVDAAYLHEIISAVNKKREGDSNFKFNSCYICELADRLMGESSDK